MAKAYWSYGGGRNSTAGIILTLMDDRFADLRENLRIVFADTGAEMPETLCYVRYFDKWLRENHGLRIEIIKSKYGSLVDYCQQQRVSPSRQIRWCTKQFKITPLYDWAINAGCDLSLIGFDYGEAHRADRKPQNNMERRYPLIEAEIDLAGCMRIIKEAGLEAPRKSGCFCCPFARKSHWEDMRTYHPDLWELTLQIEENAEGYSKGFYLKEKPLREWIANPGLELFEPCYVCELTQETVKEDSHGK